MKKEYFFENAYSIWAGEYNIPELCERISPDSYRIELLDFSYLKSSCYFYLARKTDNLKYCEYIKEKKSLLLHLIGTKHTKENCIKEVKKPGFLRASSGVSATRDLLESMGYYAEYYPVKKEAGFDPQGIHDLQYMVESPKNLEDFKMRAVKFLPDFSKGFPDNIEELKKSARIYGVKYLKRRFNQKWLFTAIREGNLTFLKNTQKLGISIKNNSSLLNEAIRWNKKKILEYLISIGMDVNTKSRDGFTPLENAYQYNKKELIDILLKAGAGKTPQLLFSLTTWKQLNALDEILPDGYDINAQDERGHTLLYYAVSRNNKRLDEIVKLLLNKGADPSVDSGDIVLSLIQWKSVDPLRTLINHGLDISRVLKKKSKLTPLHMLALFSIVNDPDERTFEFARMFFTYKVPVNSKDRKGWTPLHYAAENSLQGSTRFCEILMENGANPNALDNRKNTPLHIAAQRGRIETYKTLLQHGANPEIKNSSGLTPIMVTKRSMEESIRAGNIQNVQYLLEQGLDPNINSFLIQAVSARNIECTELLLKYGANPKIHFKRGNHTLSAEQFAEKVLKESHRNVMSIENQCKTNEKLYKLNPYMKRNDLKRLTDAKNYEMTSQKFLYLLTGKKE